MHHNYSHFYFLGIGGIGMSALARYLMHLGKEVAGYDRVRSPLCIQLEKEGIDIHYQDDFDAIPADFKNPEKCLVVYTPAVPSDFGEMLRFRDPDSYRDGITMIKRARLLGEISKNTTCLAVAGTHGKTTTSAILAHLLHEAGVKMTAFMGGILNKYNTNFIHTGDDVIVVEADEYDRSFMQLTPDIAGITAMDADHLDIYGDVSEFEKTFHDFAALVPDGKLYTNEKVDLGGKKIGVTDGFIHTENLEIENGLYHFDLSVDNQLYGNFKFALPGHHNLSNALLALSIALEHGVSADELREPLATFPGVQRRFTYRIKTDDFVLIDDYAHHPTEIDAVHAATREMYPEAQVHAIFQPHLFTRTRDFMDGFASSLAKFDSVKLLEIYPARENPIDGINSQTLSKEIRSFSKKIDVEVIQKDEIYAFAKAINTQNTTAKQQQILLMLGAGDIGLEINKLVQQLNAKNEE